MNCFSPLRASFFISIKPEETAIVLSQSQSDEQQTTFKNHDYLCASTNMSFLPEGFAFFAILSFLSFSFLILYNSTSFLFLASGVKGRTISTLGGRIVNDTRPGCRYPRSNSIRFNFLVFYSIQNWYLHQPTQYCKLQIASLSWSRKYWITWQ